MAQRVVVLDASVGVKWFRPEAGAKAARELRSQHVEDEVLIAVDSLFLYEVLAVVARTTRRPQSVERAWSELDGLDLTVVPPSAELISAAAQQRIRLGCSLYDAFPAGLAHLLGCELYSADARAHGRFPRIRLIA